jgi:hypothetical protein
MRQEVFFLRDEFHKIAIMTARYAITADVANVVVHSVDPVHMIVSGLSSTIRALSIPKIVILLFRQFEILMDIF